MINNVSRSDYKLSIYFKYGLNRGGELSTIQLHVNKYTDKKTIPISNAALRIAKWWSNLFGIGHNNGARCRKIYEKREKNAWVWHPYFLIRYTLGTAGQKRP